MKVNPALRRYAASNTRRGVESCGILAGALDEAEGAFRISTLIIPKQEGTSDTVQARGACTCLVHALQRWSAGGLPECLVQMYPGARGAHEPWSVCRCGAGAERGGDLRRAGQAVAVPAGLDPHAPHPDLLPLLSRRAHPVWLPGAASPFLFVITTHPTDRMACVAFLEGWTFSAQGAFWPVAHVASH